MPLYRCLLYILISLIFILSFPQFSLSQENDLEKAKALNQQVIKLYKQGRYEEAVKLAEKVLVIREKALGPDHPNVAQSLNNLALLYASLSDYSKAEPLYRRSLAILEKALSPDHLGVATSLNNLAELYRALGDYAKAEPLYKRSLAIREKALGLDHPNVAQSLNNLAELYRALGDNAKAEPLYKRSLAILEKALDPDHPHVATSLNNLAGLHYSLGNYAKAEPLYKRSLAIREKALGPNHPRVATSLNNLAELYRSLGDYAKAEPLYKRSLAIREKDLGPNHPDVAGSLNNLAELYRSLGDYAKAEPLYKRSLAILEKALDPDHPGVGTSLNNLAELYGSLGDYSKAEPLYKRSLAICEKALGPDHPDVATSLNNLAGLYYSLGNHAKAEPLYKRALAICEKALGSGHPNTAASLNNLAELYKSLGDYAKAKSLYKRSLAIREKALGPEHPDMAQSLNNLASLYTSLGDYGKAEPLYKRSLANLEKALGLDHPRVALGLNNLALLYSGKGEFSKGHSLFIRSQGINEKLIEQVMGFTSEEQQSIFLATRQADLEVALSLAAMHLREDASVRKDALDIWLHRKGVILEAKRRFQEALVYSDDPKAMSIFQKLARIRSQLSQLTFGGLGKEEPEAYQRKIAELETKKRDLEAKLSTLSQAYALKKKIERVDSEKLAQALPEETALLEFVRIRIFNFKAKGKEKKWLPARYFTFVLHAGKGDQVEMIDLGDAEKIDETIAGFKKEVSEIRDIKGAGVIELCRSIYELVFAKIEKKLEMVKEIFISPDGNLNLISFEVLQGPDGRFLIEDYTFNYLAAGRDIIGFGEINEKGGKSLLIGDPDFDIGKEEKDSTLRRLALRRGKELGTQKRSSGMRGFHFSRLPGTREEVEGIQALLGKERSDIYTGKSALEEVLRSKGTPRILHLATHGFFLEDLDLRGLADESTERGLVISWSDTPKVVKKKRPGKKFRIENPLLRSGIALAGANNALKYDDLEKSDGIVTAEKILGLRLRGTDMVVLSACETGLGEVQSGEGVYGLRRAFTQAGTKSLVMSMWSVPDKETKELMIEFYKNIQSGKMNRCQALRHAALKEMKIVKERYGTTNPLFWGAFVFMGEP